MAYCSGCGAKLDANANFCARCGVRRQTETPDEKEPPANVNSSQPKQVTIHEQGRRLELMLESVLQSQNFTTETRKNLKGFSGNNWEIDVWAENDNKIIAVECKNYANPIGTEKLTHFKQKIDEIKKVTSKPIEALFVTSSYFSTDAENFAKAHGIRLWDYGQLSTHYMQTQLGRNDIRGYTFELALPVDASYEEVIRLQLVNQDMVSLKKVILQWHPYFKISYNLSLIRRLPNRTTHTESFSSYLIYDANTNEPTVHSGEDGSIISDLKNRPVANYKMEFNDTHMINMLSAKGLIGTIKKLAIRRVIDTHTSEITYQVKSRDGYATRHFKVVPAPKEILITGSELVYVPKWYITFEIGGKEYHRKVLAASSTVIRDDLSECSRSHGIVDKLRGRDNAAYAICETCLRIFCQSHTVSINDRYYCKDHDPTPKPEKKGFSLFRHK